MDQLFQVVHFGNGVGVGIRQDDTELMKRFNKAIDKARKTETLVELLLNGSVLTLLCN